MTRRPMATPRNANWHVEPKHSHLRDVLYGLAWLVVIVASGVRW